MFNKYFVWSSLAAFLASVCVGVWATIGYPSDPSLGIVALTSYIAVALFLRMTVLGFAIREVEMWSQVNPNR